MKIFIMLLVSFMFVSCGLNTKENTFYVVSTNQDVNGYVWFELISLKNICVNLESNGKIFDSVYIYSGIKTNLPRNYLTESARYKINSNTSIQFKECNTNELLYNIQL